MRGSRYYNVELERVPAYQEPKFVEHWTQLFTYRTMSRDASVRMCVKVDEETLRK